MDYLLFLSIFCLVISMFIFSHKKIVLSKFLSFCFSFGALISVISYIFYAVANYFTNDGITEAVIYSIKFGLSGAAFSEYKILIVNAIIGIVLSVLMSFVLFLRKRKHHGIKFARSYLVLALMIVSFSLNPVVHSLSGAMPSIDYNSNSESEFNKYYTTPSIVQTNLTKNLVFVYAEGLERTFFNETLFPGLITHLRDIESESISFSNLYQDKYSSQTIGGIVAGQCGFPLVGYRDSNVMCGVKSYLDSATCLGDLLYFNNYSLDFYSGSSVQFGGKSRFYKTHKFNEIKGLSELSLDLDVGSYRHSWGTDRHSWGLYDDTLLDFVYDRFIELSNTEKNFALFTLTLDTHSPGGHSSASCDGRIYGDGSDSFLNSVVCSDYLISEFVKKIRKSKYSDNTTIVIASDHFSLGEESHKFLKGADRKNLFLINDPNLDKGVSSSTYGLTLDIGTTILPFIGFNGEIGLGRDLLTLNDSKNRFNDLIKLLPTFESEIMKFWDFPNLINSTRIVLKSDRLFIDDKVFSLPIFMTMDSKLNIDFSFTCLTTNIYSRIRNVKEDMPYLIIDYCDTMSNRLDIGNISSGYCLVSGTKYKYSPPVLLGKYHVFTKTEFINLIT